MIIEPPFWGSKIIEDIDIDKIAEFLNKKSLFFVQWQILRGSKTAEEHKKILNEEAEVKLNEIASASKKKKILEPKIAYGYFACRSEGNRLLVYKNPDDKDSFVTFDFPRQKDKDHLCISDYFSSDDKKRDVVAFHLVTVGHKPSEETEKLFKNDEYKDYLYWHGYCVEMAEALAEYSHKKIREELKIADKDAEKIEDIFACKYQGCRYSFGYPACPNIRDQKKIFKLIEPEKIGVIITESYQLVPEQSTSAMIVANPEAKYFFI
ncbi:hypothetical protein KKG71_01535 [Patescibacteria group bacterium]|nr:hypothetical protein [Patescibacteria group bacterium]